MDCESNDGTIWTAGNERFDFRINIGDANRLKGAGLDLLNPKTLEQVFGDPLQTIEFIAEAARPQWEMLNWDYTQFADSLIHDDDSLSLAEKAMTNALKSFFQRLGRPALAAVVEKIKRAQESLNQEAMDRITTRGDAMIDRVKAQALAELDRKLGELES